jgi:hypothetical protein
MSSCLCDQCFTDLVQGSGILLAPNTTNGTIVVSVDPNIIPAGTGTNVPSGGILNSYIGPGPSFTRLIELTTASFRTALLGSILNSSSITASAGPGGKTVLTANAVGSVLPGNGLQVANTLTTSTLSIKPSELHTLIQASLVSADSSVTITQPTPGGTVNLSASLPTAGFNDRVLGALTSTDGSITLNQLGGPGGLADLTATLGPIPFANLLATKLTSVDGLLTIAQAGTPGFGGNTNLTFKIAQFRNWLLANVFDNAQSNVVVSQPGVLGTKLALNATPSGFPPLPAPVVYGSNLGITVTPTTSMSGGDEVDVLISPTIAMASKFMCSYTFAARIDGNGDFWSTEVVVESEFSPGVWNTHQIVTPTLSLDAIPNTHKDMYTVHFIGISGKTYRVRWTLQLISSSAGQTFTAPVNVWQSGIVKAYD